MKEVLKNHVAYLLLIEDQNITSFILHTVLDCQCEEQKNYQIFPQNCEIKKYKYANPVRGSKV